MTDLLRKRLLIPLFERRDRNDRLKYLPEVQSELGRSREEVREGQFQRLRQIISYAYENTAFYRRLYDTAGIDVARIKDSGDLLRIPTIGKGELRNCGEELLSREFVNKDLIETATGGTTEAPVRVYLDRESYGRRQAVTLFFYRWFNYNLGDRIAFLWGSHADCGGKPSLKSWIKNTVSYRLFVIHATQLNEEIMYDYFRSIEKFRPKVLQSYPNSLYVFSAFLEKNDLNLDIPVIEVTAERLYPYQRKKIESVFGKKVFNWYGARELGHCATECAQHDGMHVNPYGLYFEVLKDGRQVYDEYGDLVITDLFNKAMPIIRYKIGDIGRISMRSCVCGFPSPMLEDVVGRHADIFRKSDGTLVPGINYDDPSQDELGGIDRYQIVQKDYGAFDLNVVRNAQHHTGEIEFIQDRLSVLMNERLRFRVKYVEDIPREPSGKVRFMKCDMGE